MNPVKLTSCFYFSSALYVPAGVQAKPAWAKDHNAPWLHTYPMSTLHRPHQVNPFPHVDVTVQGTWIGDFVLSASKAEDCLEIPRFAKNTTFGRESITA